MKKVKQILAVGYVVVMATTIALNTLVWFAILLSYIGNGPERMSRDSLWIMVLNAPLLIFSWYWWRHRANIKALRKWLGSSKYEEISPCERN